MRFRYILICILFSAVSYADSFDDTILWRYDLPGSGNSFSLAPNQLAGDGYDFVVNHAKPYGIGDLNWNSVSASAGKKRWGIYGRFTSFEIKDLYSRRLMDFGLSVKIRNYAYLFTDFRINNEDFVEHDKYTSIYARVKTAIVFGQFSGILECGSIPLKESYENQNVLNPGAAISYYSDDNMILSIAVKKFKNRAVRWYFLQDGMISSMAGYTIGYMNNPGTLNIGLNLSVHQLRFMLNYYGVNRLNDSIVFGIGING